MNISSKLIPQDLYVDGSLNGVTGASPVPMIYGAENDSTAAGPVVRNEELARIEIAILSTIFVLDVLGNAIVAIVLRSLSKAKKLSRMNAMIAHLTAADFFVGLFHILPQLAWKITFRFEGGQVLCKFVTYMQLVAMFASSYILVTTAIDRYVAICHPLKIHTWNVNKMHQLVVVAWALAFIFSIPQLFIFNYESYDTPVTSSDSDVTTSNANIESKRVRRSVDSSENLVTYDCISHFGFLPECCERLDVWEEYVKKSGSPSTSAGLLVTLKSTIELSELLRHSGFSYILTSRFSQDPQQFLPECCERLDVWEEYVKKSGSPSTSAGLLVTLKSTIELSELLRHSGFSYILTSRFSQDPQQPDYMLKFYITWVTLAIFIIPLLILVVVYANICSAVWKSSNFKEKRKTMPSSLSMTSTTSTSYFSLSSSGIKRMISNTSDSQGSTKGQGQGQSIKMTSRWRFSDSKKQREDSPKSQKEAEDNRAVIYWKISNDEAEGPASPSPPPEITNNQRVTDSNLHPQSFPEKTGHFYSSPTTEHKPIKSSDALIATSCCNIGHNFTPVRNLSSGCTKPLNKNIYKSISCPIMKESCDTEGISTNGRSTPSECSIDHEPNYTLRHAIENVAMKMIASLPKTGSDPNVLRNSDFVTSTEENKTNQSQVNKESGECNGNRNYSHHVYTVADKNSLACEPMGGNSLKLNRFKTRTMSSAKIRTVKLTLVVIASYIICYSPFFVFQMWAAWDPNVPFEATGMVIIMLLASLNSCTNPWIYLSFNGYIPRHLERIWRIFRGRRSGPKANRAYHSTQRSPGAHMSRNTSQSNARPEYSRFESTISMRSMS